MYSNIAFISSQYLSWILEIKSHVTIRKKNLMKIFKAKKVLQTKVFY